MSHFNKTLHSVTPPVLNDLADHVETFAHQLRRAVLGRRYMATGCSDSRNQNLCIYTVVLLLFFCHTLTGVEVLIV